MKGNQGPPKDMARSNGKRSATRRANARRPHPSELPVPGKDVEKQAIRLGFLIHDVSRLRRTAYDQLMKPLGVTRAHWWVLAHLSRNDGMMQTQLAAALEVGKASLGTLIERLEHSGLIERREDPIDKRAKRVYMARAGQQLLKKMTLEEARLNEIILKGISFAARESMIQQLGQIKRALLRRISASP